jgi:hypothetical protein
MTPFTLHVDDERHLLRRVAILNGITDPQIPDVRDVALYRVHNECPVMWGKNVTAEVVAELVEWATALGIPIVYYTCPDMTPARKAAPEPPVAGLEGII